MNLSSLKIRLDISCEMSAWQMIHMKCEVLFSLNNKKIKCYMLQLSLELLACKVMGKKYIHSNQSHWHC